MGNLRDYKNSAERRDFLQSELKTDLSNISKFSFTEELVTGKNIENLIGSTQIPLGIAGPLSIIKDETSTIHYIPLATTEGALVASVSRGCKAIYESGGTRIQLNNVGVTRAPVFKTSGITHSVEIKKWLTNNYEELKTLSESTSSHLKLLKIDSNFSGRNLFIRFHFDSEDAMGMNMATIAVEQVIPLIEKETHAKCISVSGNFDVDKKPAWLNFITGRGKRVWAEAIIPKEVVKSILKTTPEKIADLVYRKILVGSIMSGSMGFNAHYSNIIAAIFAATGQDLGQVVEGSLGITSAEVTDNGDLYFSIHLPSLMVGTVGGGTNLPTQKEALGIMGIKNQGDTSKFAGVIASTILAGELSLLASQSAGTLGESHINLARKGQR